MALLVHLGPRGDSVDGDVQQSTRPCKLHEAVDLAAHANVHVAVTPADGLARIAMRGIVQDAVGVEVEVVDLRHGHRLVDGAIDQRVPLAQPAVQIGNAHAAARGTPMSRPVADPCREKLCTKGQLYRTVGNAHVCSAHLCSSQQTLL